jgi:hypothetical protein
VDRPSADDPDEAAAIAGLLGNGLAARIDRWAADARVDEAARLRARERWLRQQAEEEGSLAGVLADVAERGASVALHVRGGRRHRGEVAALGSDFVALRSAGADVIVALPAVTSVRTLPGEASTIGDRSIGTSHRLVDVLAGLAAQRAGVLLVLADGDEAIAGVVLWVGQDVVGLRVAGGAAVTAYVPVGAIVELLVDGRSMA